MEAKPIAILVSPAFAAHLSPYILVPGGAEILLTLWLLVFGVDARRWKERAGVE